MKNILFYLGNAFQKGLPLISPTSLYLGMTVLSLLLLVIPSSLYESFVHERYLITRNVEYALFFCAGLLSFLFGVAAFEGARKRKKYGGSPLMKSLCARYGSNCASITKSLGIPVAQRENQQSSRWTGAELIPIALSLLCLIGGLFFFFWILILARDGAGLVSIILQEGYSKKQFDAAMGNASLGWILPLSIFSLTLLFWRIVSGRNVSDKSILRFCKALFLVLLTMFTIIIFMSRSRGLLVWLILSLGTAGLLALYERGSLNGVRVIAGGGAIFIFVVAVFLVFQSARY